MDGDDKKADGQSSPANTGEEIRPIGKIWGYFKWTLLAYAVFSALLVLSNVHFHLFIVRAFEGTIGSVSEWEGMFIDLHQFVSAVGVLLFLVLSSIGYARFFQRSMFNARQIEPDTDSIAPVGMWLWFIVPFANFWFPFKGVCQVWEILKSNAGESSRIPALFGYWWGFWIVSNILGQIALRMPGGGLGLQLTASNYRDLLAVNWLDMAGGVLSVISAVSLFHIARQVARLQKNLDQYRPDEKDNVGDASSTLKPPAAGDRLQD